MAMVATAAASDLHSFRLARPFLRRSTGFEAGTVAVLSCLALALWAVVVPLEFALRLTM
jgi:hypothetical protein